MDFLISLGHFCEIHGASVVFTTRNIPSTELAKYFNPLVCVPYVSNHFQTKKSLTIPFNGTQMEPLFRTDESFIPRGNDDCDGCHLYTNTRNNILMSLNIDNLHTVSEQFPNSNESPYFYNQIIKLLGKQSLSCEAYPNNRKIVRLGNDTDGYVALCFLFSLEDSKARGFQRKYSIFVMFRKMDELDANQLMIIKNVTLMIFLLQGKAQNVFDREMNPEHYLHNRSRILDMVGKNNLNYFEDIMDPMPSSNSTSRKKIKARSLMEITGDVNIYGTIHLQFCSIIGELYRRRGQPLSFRSDLIRSVQRKFRNNYCPIRQLYHMVGKRSETFRLIASNVIYGNTVIVFNRDDHINETTTFMKLMGELLPYQFESHIITNDDDNCFNAHNRSKMEESYSLCIEFGAKEVNIFQSKDIAKLHIPQYLILMEDIIKDASISDSTVMERIDCLKMEWYNRSKLIKSIINQTDDHQLPGGNGTVGYLLKQLKLNFADEQLLRQWVKLYL